MWNLVDNVCFLAGDKIVCLCSSGDALLTFLRDACQFASVDDFVLSIINKNYPGHADVQDIIRDVAATASKSLADDVASCKGALYTTSYD